MGDPQKKLELLEDKLVEQVVFDVLHMKTEYTWRKALETGKGKSLQHDDYKEVVEEVKNRYRKQIEKQSTTN